MHPLSDPSHSTPYASSSDLSSGPAKVLRCTQCLCTMRVNAAETKYDNLTPQTNTKHLPPHASYVIIPPTPPNSVPTIDTTSTSIGPNALEQVHKMMADITSPSVPAHRYPLCTACGHALESILVRQQTELEQEIESYALLIENLEHHAYMDHQRELDRLDEEERNLIVQLASLELEEARADQDDLQLAKDEMELSMREKAFYLNVNQFQSTLAAFHVERESLNARVMHASLHLDRLRATNVVNDVFRIGSDGQFGTIDGFRFGRVPVDMKDWHEVNAGWGQACLMLQTLACRLSFEFQGYRLIPMGSTSKVQKLSVADTSTNAQPSVLATYDLHGGDMSAKLTRFLVTHSAFDQGLVAYLQCLAQLGAHCQSLDFSFNVPYRIVQHCIGEVSIKLQRGTRKSGLDTWDRAAKFVLTNLKWIMAFAAKRVVAKPGINNGSRSQGSSNDPRHR